MKLKRKVSFDVCTFCNHRCTFCSNSDPRTVKSQTTLHDFVVVMKNMTQYVEVTEMGLSAKGEVLINKELAAIVAACKNDFNIPYVYFSTNGAMLGPEKALELLDAGIDSIKFSINAVDATTYKSVHLADDFDLVIQNLNHLLELKQKKFPRLKVMISSVINMNEAELEKAFRGIYGENVGLIDKIMVYPVSYTPKFDWVETDQPITKKCLVPFKEIYINSDGTLGLCCKDYFDVVNFGSLLEHDFMEVYNSEGFKEMRTMHETGVFPAGHLCKNCLLYGDA